jgi:F-type H+-transporting ATPase subunit b
MATETQTSTGAHGGAPAVFPPFNTQTFPSQLLWLAVTFGLLYWLAANVILPRVGGIVDARRSRVAGDLDEARRLAADSESARVAYEKALADARGNAAELAQKTRAELLASTEARAAAAEAELAGKIEDSERRIAAIRDRAMGEVGAIANEAASAIVERLSGRPAQGEVADAVAAAMRR